MNLYYESYGCSANQADMERILGLLARMGFSPVEDPSKADLIILNTCAVKLTTENRMISRYKALAKFGKPVIVTGCLPRMNLARARKECKGFSAFLDPNSIDKLPEIVKRVLAGERGIIEFGEASPKLFSLPRLDLHPVIHIVPIAFGCLGDCAFCGVKLVRGRLVSVPPGEIKRDIELALRSGKKEIWLTSQDNAVYGLDIGTNLNELLSQVLEIPGKFRLRIGMMNPGVTKALLPDLLDHYRDERVYKFVHIPVQSGSDRVLAKMKRQHSVEDFEELVDQFRSEIPDVSISTDIIVGFPGETEEDFQETLALIERTRPDIVNISKFYPRPGTLASKMKKVPTDVISQRSRKLAEVCQRISLESNRAMVGRTVDVLVSEPGIARTPNYKKVRIDGKLGDFYLARITQASPRGLTGEVVKQSSS